MKEISNYVEHPLIKKNKLERRTYQEVIAAQGVKKNLMCVLPTGLGKTAIAILLTANRLERFPDSKILMLAPTKPLIEQHYGTFMEFLNLDKDSFALLTGKDRPEFRENLWREKKLFFATPQVVENDLLSGRLSLKDFSLVIFDECHRAVKEYSYVFIAERYVSEGENPRILGLTASPGGEIDRIKEVGRNLFIETYEVRTENDPDVRPYVKKMDIRWIKIPLNAHFERLLRYLNDVYKEKMKDLKKLNLVDRIDLNRKELLMLRGEFLSKISQERDSLYLIGLSILSSAMKVQHAIELLETQGIHPLYNYFNKLKKDRTKASKMLFHNENFKNAVMICEWMYQNGLEHPKIEKLKEILRDLGDKKAIIFTQYRNTVDLICRELEGIENLMPVGFKGQKEGFTQKMQREILEKFRNNEYNVLVCTSVGEEGLDIPKVDVVIFYEPIPSEIRSIQRRGRTARHKEGKIYILMAENTRDVVYYWKSFHKERKMKEFLKSMREEINDMDFMNGQKNLLSYNNEIVVYVDDRERSLAEKLSRKVKVIMKRLEVADFLVSDRVAVERKKDSDFVNSIIDGRLFDQLNELKRNFEIPVLIIEGKNMFSRQIHPNALFGAISSIILDYRIPILWSYDEEETVEIIFSLARREQEEKKREIRLRGKKISNDIIEMQKYIVAGLPYIDNVLSERLLERFKTVRNIFNAEESELMKIKGIGEKKAREIFKILNTPYKEGGE